MKKLTLALALMTFGMCTASAADLNLKKTGKSYLVGSIGHNLGVNYGWKVKDRLDVELGARAGWSGLPGVFLTGGIVYTWPDVAPKFDISVKGTLVAGGGVYGVTSGGSAGAGLVGVEVGPRFTYKHNTKWNFGGQFSYGPAVVISGSTYDSSSSVGAFMGWTGDTSFFVKYNF